MRLIKLTASLNYTALWTRRDSHLGFCCAGDICVKEKHRTVCKSCEFHMNTARKSMYSLQSEIRFSSISDSWMFELHRAEWCIQRQTLEKLFSRLLEVETLYGLIEKVILQKWVWVSLLLVHTAKKESFQWRRRLVSSGKLWNRKINYRFIDSRISYEEEGEDVF